MSAEALYAAPLFDPLRHWLERLPPRPDTQAIAGLADDQTIVRPVSPNAPPTESKAWTAAGKVCEG